MWESVWWKKLQSSLTAKKNPLPSHCFTSNLLAQTLKSFVCISPKWGKWWNFHLTFWLSSFMKNNYFLWGVCGCVQAAARSQAALVFHHHVDWMNATSASRAQEFRRRLPPRRRDGRSFTLAKSRTSNRSKASNRSLFLRWNLPWQAARKVRIFFRHRNWKQMERHK